MALAKKLPMSVRRLNSLNKKVEEVNKIVGSKFVIADEGRHVILNGFATVEPYFIYRSQDDMDKQQYGHGGYDYDGMYHFLDGLQFAAQYKWKMKK